MDWFKSTGIIQYDPPRPGMKTRVKDWCVLKTDPGIVSYFQWFMNRHWWEIEDGTLKRPFAQPAWGSHVSLIRGERINPDLHKKFWKKYDGLEVEFRYSNWVRQTNGIRENGDAVPDHFWFVSVELPMIWDVRAELGLPNKTLKGRPYSLHLTVARAFQETKTRNKYIDTWDEKLVDKTS